MPSIERGKAPPGPRLRRRWRHMLGWTALLLDHLKPVRVSLLVLGVAVGVAMGVDQAAELFLIALWTDPSGGRYVALLATCALAGLSIWYAARNAYRLRYPRWPALQDERAAPLRDWLPRLLGAAVPLLVCLGYVLALAELPHGPCGVTAHCEQRNWRATGLLLESAALIVFFMTRRRMWSALSRRVPALAPPAPRPSDEKRVWRVRDLGLVPCSFYGVVVALNIFATGLIAWKPEALDGIGPLAILLIAAAFLSFSGSLLCMAGDRRGVPLLSTMLLLSATLHWLHLNDNHKVRQYPVMSTHEQPMPPLADTRPAFDAYADAWLADRCASRAPCPVVLVSAEGGGIRGAAWTALVLARLTALVDAGQSVQGEPLLARYLFAASGVSGGSLGLATYASLLGQPAATLEPGAQAMLGHDFLAPTLANTFFVDFTQRWLPGAWLNDRARALTRAWESAARRQGVTAFAQPFAAPYRSPDGKVLTTTPALFLNSTTVTEGRRFVQHPFQPIATPQRQPWTAGFDGSGWLDPRVPLSEVVLNSARFTYVSPAGTLESRAANPPLPNRLQLVDGGYFENSGTTTLLEVMQLLRVRAAQRGIALRFIVIHISNDPQMSDFIDRHDASHPLPLYAAACPAAPGRVRDSVRGEASAPLAALLDTRAARGEYARVQLLRALATDDVDPAHGDVLWHFRLCPGDYPIPLGWTISAPVFTELGRQLEQHYPLARMAAELRREFAPQPP
ncbi:patatin-like phospholipase family protein [Dyella soli]|uniref:PNPLA domain-containing protein n=1 Tax=Dyella soli TaxID=522319 RepID=A0A4R0YKU4_9GAMM|nr:patatin-like phospholipase family protein [Dyella soli]TCI09088.1 hypothetical protein EZM97_22890 [Dyella soli]